MKCFSIASASESINSFINRKVNFLFIVSKTNIMKKRALEEITGKVIEVNAPNYLRYGDKAKKSLS